MDFETIKYAAVTRQGDEYPKKYMLTLTMEFNGMVTAIPAIPTPDPSPIVSSNFEDGILTVVSTHRNAQDLYAATVAHLKMHDILHSDYEPPVLSAKPEDLPVELTTEGPRRSERVSTGASN